MEFSRDFLGTWTDNLCAFSLVLLETKGNEQRGRELLEKSIALFENGLPDAVRHRERLEQGLCYLLAGDNEKALDAIERKMASHSVWDWRWFRQLPTYDTLRDDPRFVRLNDKYDRHMSEQVAELRRRDKPAFEF